MMSKVVRNPNRHKTTQEKQTPIVPAWERSGVSPAFVFPDSSQDFRMRSTKRKKVQTPPPRVPKQTKVSVGEKDTSFSLNEEMVNGPIYHDEIPSPPPVYSRPKNLLPKEEEYDEDDEYEDEEDEEEFEDEDSEQEEVPQKTSSLLNFKEGQYALLVRGVIVLISSDLRKMELTIESIVSKGYQGEEIGFEEIILIRRVPLRMGVLAVE